MFVSSVFVLWCFVCQQWYVCGIKQNCKETTQNNLPATTSKKVAKPPILFQWGNKTAITSTQFSVLQDSMIKELGEEDTLEITGFYFKNEATDSLDIGLERAKEVKVLFTDKFPADRIKLRSEVLEEMEGVREHLFESITLNGIKPSNLTTTISEHETNIEEHLVKTDDGVLIYFPFNSANKEVNIEVDGYLQQLSTRLQSSDEKVHITGHTDNEGDAKVNYDIGRQRAKMIRDILLESGVSRSQITIFSKGETEPMVSNETEAGRQKNRRTEIKIFE